MLTPLLRDSVKECFILVYNNRYTDNSVKPQNIVIKILLLFAEDSAARAPACLWLERAKNGFFPVLITTGVPLFIPEPRPRLSLMAHRLSSPRLD